MGFALTPGEAPLHFSRSKNVMHVENQFYFGEWE